jgi:tetratricopeptide (TPR) repeat protein
VIFAMMLVCGPARARGADTGQFDAANRLYEAQKYADAKQAYDALVKSGPLSANLFYNRGNAEWKLGDGGRAIADYERALELQPSHPEARANLEYARNATGARMATPVWWQQALGALNASAAAILLSVCGWVALFCVAIALLRREGRMGPVVTLAISLLVGGYAGGCLWEANAVATRAVVIARTTDAREAPTDVAPMADTLPAGTEVLAPEERGQWTYCTLPSGARAWVPTDALERVRPGQG